MRQTAIVTVLGAGTSTCCGYPLAADLFPRLEEFGKTLGENQRLLRTAIEHVASRAQELECATPDDLALQVEQRRFGGTDNYRAALRTLVYTRIATDLFFLHLEQRVASEAMQRFRAIGMMLLARFRIGSTIIGKRHTL
jgi:hypothetical protein